MDWKEIGGVVAKVAPVLGSVLLGPAGAVSEAAGSLLASFLGVDPEPQEITRALADPVTLLRIKELESVERQRLLEWQTSQLQAELANVVSARQREVELAKSGHGASWSTSIVSCIVTLGFFAMLWLVLKSGGKELGDAGLMLLGSLSTAFGAVVNYYLGSSSGSSSKDSMIYNSTPVRERANK